MANKIVFFYISILIFQGCQYSGELCPTVKINPFDKEKKITAEIHIEKVIPLETMEESLIGEVDRIMFCQNKYYILDYFYAKALLVFGEDGKFINKTSQGRGPNEITSITDFAIDKENNRIIVWGGGRFNTYSANLNEIINKSNLIPAIIKSFEFVNDSQIIVFSSDGNLVNYNIEEAANHKFYQYYVYNRDFTKTVAEFFPIEEELSHLHLPVPISNHEGRLLLLKLYDYHIYEMVDNKPKPILNVDFGSYGLEKKDIEKGHEYIWRNFENNRKVLILRFLSESSNYISFFYFIKGRYHFNVFSKTTESLYTENNFSNILAQKLKIVAVKEKNVFVGLINAVDLKFVYPDEDEYEYVGEGDNPCLVEFTIKEN